MAYDPGPPPKRSDYLTNATYQMVRARWKRDKEAWRLEQRRLRQQQAGRVVGAAVTAAMTFHGIYDAVTGPALASTAFPGHERDAAEAMIDMVEVRRTEERDRQSQDMDEGTRNKGYSSGYDSI